MMKSIHRLWLALISSFVFLLIPEPCRLKRTWLIISTVMRRMNMPHQA